jgi:hypothetical protein
MREYVNRTMSMMTAMLAARSIPAGARLQEVCNVTADACRGACYAGMRQERPTGWPRSRRRPRAFFALPAGRGPPHGYRRGLSECVLLPQCGRSEGAEACAGLPPRAKHCQ